MLGPDFSLPVNLQWICRQGILFFFSFKCPKKCWRNDKKGGKEQQCVWITANKYTHQTVPFCLSILLKKSKKLKQRSVWVDRWMGRGRKCQSKPLAISHFISLGGNMSKTGRRKREHWNLREGEDVCEKIHKMWFHFKPFWAETTATFSWVFPLIF